MTRAELVERISEAMPRIGIDNSEKAVREILESISSSLESGERVEIRGFGSFNLRDREARKGRNPKSGDSVMVGEKTVVHFKTGKELRARVDNISKT
ncbi:integration host factor subunit beta [Vibrio sp. D431a]|uniref:integration host factor subunit beta n=1 Tax=Vibrio sp. D431a TaxID=2837388 RepID=UPI0025561A53|nr:integration host factor subunit beta [Vibrio sp. D431a]